jgi:hypothetical protein
MELRDAILVAFRKNPKLKIEYKTYLDENVSLKNNSLIRLICFELHKKHDLTVAKQIFREIQVLKKEIVAELDKVVIEYFEDLII